MSAIAEVEGDLCAAPRTWLVTGAAGFIGSHLLEHLLRLGQQVRALDNFATGHRHNLEAVRSLVGEAAWQRCEFIEADIRSLEACREACHGIDLVLHQAALGSVPRSIADPVMSNAVNIDGFLNMLVAARESGVKRFVYASSSSVYGDSPELPKVEERIGLPLSPYAATKAANECYAAAFKASYGFETIGLRYFNVFGPRQDPNGAYAAVIPRWVAALRRGEQCVIYGDGETSRDFCYVANVVQANILAAYVPGAIGHHVYNIACGEQLTLNELFAALRREVAAVTRSPEAPAARHEEFRTGDVRHSLASVERAVAGLGYSPRIRVQEGVRITVGESATSADNPS